MTLEIREFSPELEVREADSGEWTLEGLAVPYGETITHNGYREEFAPGAFSEYRSGATLYGQHGHLRGEFPIGLVTKAEDRPEGLWVRAKISQTERGKEAYVLLRDGVLKSLSVGFAPEQHETRSDDLGDVTVYTRARFGEVSIVGMPAYPGAAITAVREHDNPNSPADTASAQHEGAPVADVTTEITEVRASIEDLSRSFELLKAGASSTKETAPMKYRSEGEFVQALYRGEVTQDEVDTLHRAAVEAFEVRALTNVGNTADASGITRPAWIDRDVRIIQEKRPILEFFSKEPLPAEGMSVSYPVFASKTGDVAKQASESDDLTYMELVVTTGTAAVDTYGAYSQLTKQVIDRQDASYVNKVLDVQRNSYAKVTNAAVRALLLNTPGAYNVATPLPALASQGDAKPWIDSALDGMQKIAVNSQGLTADAWVMGFDNYRKLVGVYDGNKRPVFAINGDGQNTVGTADLRNFGATVAGLPVLVDFGLTGTDSFIVSREALTVLEDGAKYLDDVNVVNLTSLFSIYGYLALTKNDVKGISRVVIPAT